MTGSAMFCASLGLALVAVAAIRADSAGELKPGDQAPAFTLQGSDGKTYSLAEYEGKQPIVLAWFVKAFTSG